MNGLHKCGVLLAALFATIIAQPTRAEHWAKPGDFVENAGPTHSMDPVFPIGARARLMLFVPGDRVVGCVVLIRDYAHDCQIAHYCIAQGFAANGQRWYKTKGCNNRDVDPVRWRDAEISGILDLPIRLP